MSKPRPIHRPHRELRSTPDDAEPSYSYEQESFLGGREIDVEDEFHRRLAAGSRRESAGSHGAASGNSFWRTSDSTISQTPNFSSMSLKAQTDTAVERKSVGLLGEAMRSQAIADADRVPTTAGGREHVSNVLFLLFVKE